ncbi:MAG: TetR family transcriptional regulator [Spirochaetaceae bacterium]|nr:TetR family transcriptional regulator [Spirochaetaceae bacterium]
MPPKAQFSKQQILDTALKISIESGISTLTVRKLAEKLGCSVAPIYVNFENSEALVQAVMDMIRELSWKYATKSYTDIGFFNIGIGQILFVKDYPLLYMDLLNNDPHCMTMSDEQAKQMIDIMEKDDMLQGLSREQNSDLLLKMSIFTMGLCLTMTKDEQVLPLEKILSLLEETAHQFIVSLKNNYHDSYTPRTEFHF